MRNGGKITEKEVKNKNKKIVIKDKSKFIKFIAMALVIIILIIVVISLVSNRKIEIDENTNISELNAEKYSEEIKLQYEQEGKDSKFMEDWNNVQDSVGRYLIENYPADPEQLPTFINEINETLKSDDWGKFNVEIPTMWNGTWSMKENGNISFKFVNKEVEPSWASFLSDQGYIVLN